jgi:glutaminyl-peptide cyclotransferase
LSPLPRTARRALSRLRAGAVSARIGWHRSEVRLEPLPASPAPPGEVEPRTFDAARAWALLEAQSAFGSRAPGSEGHARTLRWLSEQLAASCDEVTAQHWRQRVARGPGKGRAFRMTNLLGRIYGREDADGPPALMLSAHWDTRPVADQDPDPARRHLPVPGANDGASGVAVLLELARVLRLRRPARTVAIALWDGEDLGEYYYGSRLFGAVVRRPAYRRWRAREGVVVDMVGGRELRCTDEANSRRLHPALWARVHDAARALGLQAHFSGVPRAITDDHIFLSRGGIPTVLLIDYAYPHWHTTHDVAEHCEPRSLEVVGRVLERLAGADGTSP